MDDYDQTLALTHQQAQFVVDTINFLRVNHTLATVESVEFGVKVNRIDWNEWQVLAIAEGVK